MSTVSLDLGGSHIAGAVVRDGAVISEVHMPTGAGSLAEELDSIAAVVRRCIAESEVEPSTLDGMAMGFCGVVDGETGEILSTIDKYTDAPRIDLHGWARQEFNLSLRIENDACLALLGERVSGAARGARDVVMITLGTGIGGAAMLGGRLLRSRSGQAGCLGGHLPVNFRGRRCSCGAIGCAETEASTTVLPILYREHPGFAQSSLAKEPILNFKKLFEAADQGDPIAQDVRDHCVHVWSVLTVGLIHAYGPELVIFGGGVMQRGDELLDPIRAYVAKHVWRTSRGLPRVEIAQLGDRAALIGGSTLFAGDPVTPAGERRGGGVHV